MLVVGETEMLANSVSARKKGDGDLGVFSVEDFANMVNDEVANMLKEI
jgi:threonyl-tRNA synthetase